MYITCEEKLNVHWETSWKQNCRTRCKTREQFDLSLTVIPHLELELEFEVAAQRLYATYEGICGPRSRNTQIPHYCDCFAASTLYRTACRA